MRATPAPRPKVSSRVLVLGLVLLAFGLRLWRLDVQDIWWDEARNIDVALRPWAAIPGAPELDIHPPGYFLLLHAWLRLAGHTAFATRFFSVWWGVILVPLLVHLARRLGLGRAAWGAALYATLAPFLIGEAQETRMYTLAFAVLALTAWAFWATWEGHPRAWIPLGVGLAASVLIHYSTVFVLLACYAFAALGLILETRHRDRRVLVWRRARALLAAGGLALLLFAPQAPRAYRQITPYGNPNLTVPSPAEYARTLWHAYTLGIPADGAWVTPALAGLAAMWIVGAALAFLDRQRRPRGDVLGFLALGLLLPVVLYYLVLIERATFAPRYISFIMPFFALAVGWSLAGWWRHRASGVLITLIVSALLGVGIHADQFNPAYFREDTSGLAAWLMETAGPEDLVLIDVPYPLGFYYPRFSKNPDIPPPPDPPTLTPAYYLFVDIHTVSQRLTALARGKRRIFWVQWYKSDTDPRGVVTYLLRMYGVHVGERAFRGYRVDIYRVPPDATYEVAPKPAPVVLDFTDGLGVRAAALRQAPPLSGPVDPTAAPRPVGVMLTWVRDGHPSRPYKASVRLWDPAGHLVAQDDRRLLNDRHVPPPYWEPGERAQNIYLLDLPPGTPPGVYTVTVRVYDPATGEPLTVTAAPAVLAGVDATVGRVTVRRATHFPDLAPTALREAPIGLVEARLGTSQAAPGTVVPVHAVWRVRRPLNVEARVRLALVNAAGGEHGIWVGRPVPWYPTTAWRAGEVVRSTLDWRLPPDTPAGSYTVHLTLVTDDGRAWGPVFLGSLQVTGRPRRFEPPAGLRPLNPAPRFGEIAQLVGYDLAGTVQPAATLAVTLTWRALAPATISYTGFVQLLDGQNRVIAQEDHIPQRGAAPTTSWLAGEYVQDRYDLRLPDPLPPGPYRLIVGLYDARTMRRLPVADPAGRPLGDHVVLQTWEDIP